ncbi:DUF4397 domain-containing protein [Halorussus caseinilyticus]|uniref:DUF4397 domain-containing protein n=1 Tax=Halorussus caseinilyticus TaxID=3034025 RepID=A0ABD5WIZ1_9EURY|nr:DUF4397 domain-containing protein [Halorussus sp. DT72]
MTANRTTLKRAVAVGVALLVVASLGAGTVASLTQDEGNAQVRVAHMSPDAPAVNVQVDGETAVEDLEYSDVTEYLDLSAGDHDVTIVTAENETAVFEGQVSVEANEKYTVMAAGEVSENATEEFQVTVLSDATEAPTGNQSSVRLVHASPDAGPVDVTFQQSGDAVADNATFGNATDYTTVEDGVYTFEVRPAAEDNNGTVVATFNESLLEGNAYTGFVAGYASPEDAPANESLSLFLEIDVNGTEQAAETTEMVEETTTVEMDGEEEETTTEA